MSGGNSVPQNKVVPGEIRERPVGEEAILKVTKEIVVKFIEVGRLSPANFTETFREIHRTVRDAVRP